MTVEQFFNKYKGIGIDYDNWYGFQCMDLYHQYDKECIGSKNYPAPAAKDVWNKYDSNFYTRIANTPTNIPQEGDVIIWGTLIGPYGHIAVFYAGDVINFTSFDQNFPINSKCHFQVHSYKGVLGWLRPKQLPKDVIIPVTGPETTTPEIPQTPPSEEAIIPPASTGEISPEVTAVEATIGGEEVQPSVPVDPAGGNDSNGSDSSTTTILRDSPPDISKPVLSLTSFDIFISQTLKKIWSLFIKWFKK